jgi:hypothetical protein
MLLGALADAEAGLLLLPEHPDLLFMRAWVSCCCPYIRSAIRAPHASQGLNHRITYVSLALRAIHKKAASAAAAQHDQHDMLHLLDSGVQDLVGNWHTAASIASEAQPSCELHCLLCWLLLSCRLSMLSSTTL